MSRHSIPTGLIVAYARSYDNGANVPRGLGTLAARDAWIDVLDGWRTRYNDGFGRKEHPGRHRA